MEVARPQFLTCGMGFKQFCLCQVQDPTHSRSSVGPDLSGTHMLSKVYPCSGCPHPAPSLAPAHSSWLTSVAGLPPFPTSLSQLRIYLTCLSSPAGIPELRAGLAGSRGGRGLVPHAWHDAAWQPPCTGRGMMLLQLSFARCKVSCPEWGGRPPHTADPPGGVCGGSAYFNTCFQSYSRRQPGISVSGSHPALLWGYFFLGYPSWQPSSP